MEYRIENMKAYTSGMAKSLMDKCYFIPYLDESIKYIIDIGCGDGTLINYMADIMPHLTYIGYDNNSAMIMEAVKKSRARTNVRFTNGWHYIESMCSPDNSAVILSSVLHEVYSYCEEPEIRLFWDRILKLNPKYICIRDMMCDSFDCKPATSFVIHSIYSAAEKDNSLHDRLMDFEEVWGDLKTNHDVIHFLLKYRYKENWQRELHENYLPICMSYLYGLIDRRKYSVAYCEQYTLPFLEDKVLEDFDIRISQIGTTHVKLIFKR